MGIRGILAALLLLSTPVVSAPAPAPAEEDAVAAYGPSWVGSIAREGKAVFGPNDQYKVFRNVKDYGARGDGSTDDTAAIQRAIVETGRCGQGCDSSTTTPALVYFPPGTYRVSSPIIQYYYTQLVGDPASPPTLKPLPGFTGIGVIDSDPYADGGVNWYTNQNNFFRQIRNFVIDLRDLNFDTGTGIHWQVAQATSLQNIRFEMRTDGGEANRQQGIFMDNGSGGLMSDLVFNGGRYGAFLGNQQFTTRNLEFNNCKTAIFMNWNWAWTFHDVRINNCGIGIDMANGGASGSVGSILLLDSKISNTGVGVATAYSPNPRFTNGTLILQNVDMTTGVGVGVRNTLTGAAVLGGNQKVDYWLQGKAYNGGAGSAVQGPQTPLRLPDALLSGGRIVSRSKPQYETADVSRFKRAKANGAKGDGRTDDTDAIQRLFNGAGPNDIIYFDHGMYLITKTVQVPKDIKVVGEIWPLLMASGPFFGDQNNPQPLFRVGEPGDVGSVEMQDLMIETHGPQPGAILMEWNVAGRDKGAAGLWDVHFRVGGSQGTLLQSDRCKKTPEVTTPPKPECIGAFLLMHVTKDATAYFENTWFWVSDHELDLQDHSQINIYNGRGVLIESTKGVWLWGTASEHNVLYNYQVSNAANVFMGLIQTETAYFQGNPDATVPFTVNAEYKDPDFKRSCQGQAGCARTWGVRVTDSRDVFVYGAGLYSFFDNYGQTCLQTESCQQHMVSIENSQVHMVGLSTKASVNMVTVNGQGAVFDRDNRNNFCATVAVFNS